MTASVTALAACASSHGAAGDATPSTPQSATASACADSSPAARAPVGQAQALTVVAVRVSTAVRTSSGVIDLGAAACVNVGVGQRVALHVRARVPPLPAESPTTPALLSAIAISQSTPSTATPQSGGFTLTFTAQAAGATAITYLAATCTLPPGVC